MSTRNPGGGFRPSTTNLPCSVCTSMHRCEIEVALAIGLPLELIAKRFSRGGETFSGPDVQSHDDHLHLIERALAEMTAAWKRGFLLDHKTAAEIVRARERNSELVRAAVLGEVFGSARPHERTTGAEERDDRP